MISDVEFNNETFLSNVFSGLTLIPVTQTSINGQDYYTGEFTFMPRGNQSNVYLILDVSQQLMNLGVNGPIRTG